MSVAIFDDAAGDCVSALLERPVETYSVHSGNVITRTILDRSGVGRFSSVGRTRTARSRDPQDAFDISWLTSREVPSLSAPLESPVRAVDLFAGCGGLTVGLVEAARALNREVHHVMAVEIDEKALSVYEDNFPTDVLLSDPLESWVNGDLGATPTRREREFVDQIGHVDVVVGGPPCQGHSDLNNHTRRDDPKNGLYLRMARFVEVARPTSVMIENVPGVAHDKSGVVARAIDAMVAAGYRVTSAVVRVDELGAPQSRRRHVVLASRDRECLADAGQLTVDFAGPRRPVMWAIDDLQELRVEDVFNSASKHSSTNEGRIRHLFEHDIYDLPDQFRPDCHRLKPHSYRSVYGRMHPDRPAPTITSGFGSTGQGRFVHPRLPRTLTPHEAARLQGFPDWFKFRESVGRRALQQMIGNAVPSRLAFAGAAALLR